MQDTLPVMDALEATASRILTGEGRYLPIVIGGRSLELAFSSGNEIAGTPALLLPVEMEGDLSLLGIQFRPDGILSQRLPGGIPVEPADLRRALVASLSREILDALSGSLNLGLKIGSSEVMEAGELTRYSFRVSPKGGEPEAWGFLQPSRRLLSVLIAAAEGWPLHPGPLAASITSGHPVILATVGVEASVLSSLEPGDLLVACPADSPGSFVRLPNGIVLRCPLPAVNPARP